MINDNLKTQAKLMLQRGIPIDEIADELDLPEKLVKEWQSKLDPKDLTVLQSNVMAMGQVLKGELVPINEDKIRNELEKAAIEIASQSYKTAGTGDVVHAKSLQLLSDTVSKMYQTFILKGGAGNPSGAAPAGGTMFEQLMRD